MWVYRGQIVDFGENIDNLHDKVLELNKIEKLPSVYQPLIDIQPFWEDDPEPEKPKLTNCKNCGAPLVGTKCEYCGTEYAPKIEKPYCEWKRIFQATPEKAVPDSLVVTQENLQNSFFALTNAADDAERALMDFSEEIKMIESKERILWFFVYSMAVAALIVIIAFVLNLFA